MLPSGLTLNSEDQFCCPYDTTLIQASGPERGSNSAAAHDFRSSGPPLFGLHGYLGTAPKAGSKLDFLTYFFILPAGEAVSHTMRLPSSTICPPLEGPQGDLNMVSIGDRWPQSPRPRRCQGLAPCRRGWTIPPPPSAEAAAMSLLGSTNPPQDAETSVAQHQRQHRRCSGAVRYPFYSKRRASIGSRRGAVWAG